MALDQIRTFAAANVTRTLSAVHAFDRLPPLVVPADVWPLLMSSELDHCLDALTSPYDSSSRARRALTALATTTVSVDARLALFERVCRCLVSVMSLTTDRVLAHIRRSFVHTVDPHRRLFSTVVDECVMAIVIIVVRLERAFSAADACTAHAFVRSCLVDAHCRAYSHWLLVEYDIARPAATTAPGIRRDCSPTHLRRRRRRRHRRSSRRR